MRKTTGLAALVCFQRQNRSFTFVNDPQTGPERLNNIKYELTFSSKPSQMHDVATASQGGREGPQTKVKYLVHRDKGR